MSTQQSGPYNAVMVVFSNAVIAETAVLAAGTTGIR